MSINLANIQVKKILDFIETLILKDTELADKGFIYDTSSTEAQETYANYIGFINAFSRNDTADSYSKRDLEYANSRVTSSSDDVEEFLEYLRYHKYKEFYGYSFEKSDTGLYVDKIIAEGFRTRDFNDYFNGIFKEKYEYSFVILNFESFKKRTISDDFFASAFFKEDGEIIYYNQDIINVKDLHTFLSTFDSTLAYFNLMYKNTFYANEPHFKAFGRTMLIFMTMQNYISKTLVNILDIDLLSNYEAKNLLVSNQLDDFLSLPIIYKRKLLKNLNYLIANKGTNKIFETIISIFDLDDVKIYKYILAKDYYKTINSNILFNVPHLSFLKLDVDEYDIVGKVPTAERVSVDKVTGGDKLWDTDSINNFIHKSDKNYINTKYISIESTTSIFRKSLELSYYINSIYEVDRYLKQTGLDITCFSVILFEVSEANRIRLTDVITAMEYLLIRQHNLEDILPSSPTATTSIYGFNNITFKDNKLYYDSLSKDFVTGEDKLVTKTIHLNKWAIEFLNRNINIHDLETKTDYGNSDYISSFNTAFKKNVKILEVINQLINGYTNGESIIQAEFDHNTFMELSELKKALTISTRRYDYFTKKDGTQYTSYMGTDGYFLNECPDMYTYLNINTYGASLTDQEVNDIIVNKLFYLLNSLNNFVDTNDLSVLSNISVLFASDIKENIYKLVKIFKSYTIELSDLNIFYTYNDKHLNSIMPKEHFFQGNYQDATEDTNLKDNKKLVQDNNFIMYDVENENLHDNGISKNEENVKENISLRENIEFERITY